MANAAIEGLTIKNGVAGGTRVSFGGGIYNGGTLRLTNSTVSGNSAINGGGIFNFHTSTLTLTNSTVSGNSATDGRRRHQQLWHNKGEQLHHLRQ